MQQHPVGADRALQHHPALRRIDPEPASRCRRALVLDADGSFDDVAHAVAEFEIGAGGGGEGRGGEKGYQERDERAPPTAVITGLVPVISLGRSAPLSGVA